MPQDQKNSHPEMRPVPAAHIVTESIDDSMTDSDAVTFVNAVLRSNLSVDIAAEPRSPVNNAPEPDVSFDRADLRDGLPKASNRRPSLRPKKSHRCLVALSLLACWWLIYGLANMLMYPLTSNLPIATQNFTKDRDWTDRGVAIAFCVVRFLTVLAHIFMTASNTDRVMTFRDHLLRWPFVDCTMFAFILVVETFVQNALTSTRKTTRSKQPCRPEGYLCREGKE